MDVVPGGAELGGDDLRQRGRVALPLRRHADVDVDLAARIDPHGRALIGAQARPLGVAGETDADPAHTARACLLPPAPLVVRQERERLLEGRGEIAGIVGDGHAVFVGEAGPVRHLGGAYEVAAADLGRVEAEPARADVHQALHHEHRLGPSGRAIRRVESFRGDHAGAGVAVVRHAVRPGHMVDRVRGEAVALKRIGADVGDERAVDRDDRAVAREPDAHVVILLAVVAHAREVLATALDPLDGSPEPVRRGRDQDLFGIDRALGAEATAHVRHDYTHFLDRQAQRRGDHVAQGVRALGRRRHHECAGATIPIREHAPRLDRHGAEPRVAHPLPDDEMRPGHGALGVADGPAGHHRRVVGPARVHACRRGLRRFGRRQGREPLVFDRQRLERVRELVGALGHHDRDGLADVADDVAREHRLGPGASFLRAAVRGRHGRRDLTEVRGAPGEDDAGQGPRARGDHLDEARGGLGAPHDAQVQDAVTREVVDEPSAAPQETLVFFPQRRGADHVARNLPRARRPRLG